MARLLPLIWILSTSLLAFEAGTSEFIGLTQEICKTPCGVDPLKDQEEREKINEWMKKWSKDLATQKTIISELCNWSLDKKVLTVEKRAFLLARFKEKKSPFAKALCQ